MPREEPPHRGGGLETILGVGAKAVGSARGGERHAVANACEHVRNQSVVLDGVDDRVGRHDRQSALLREMHQPQVALRLLRREVLLEFDVEAVFEDRAQTAGLAGRRLGTVLERALDATERSAGERDQSVAAAFEILQPKTSVALTAPHLRARDQLAEMRVTALVFDQEHDVRAVFEGELAAENRLDSALPRVGRESHRTVESVAIGQRDRRQTELRRRLYQLFGMRSALQEAEVRPRVEFCIFPVYRLRHRRFKDARRSTSCSAPVRPLFGQNKF